MNFWTISRTSSGLFGRGGEGRALIFFRRVYYLRVPSAYAHPEASWAMNPEELQTDDTWRSLFRNQHIRWVIRRILQNR
jgi:hypothetical protein